MIKRLTTLLFSTSFFWIVTVSAQAQDLDLDLVVADSGSFYIHALFNDKVEHDLLLDTGASYVSLNEETFALLNSDQPLEFSRHIYGAMANGKVEKIPLYILPELILAQGCVLHNLEVAVLKNADKGILGMNALKKLQSFTLQLEPAKLTSKGCYS